MSPSYRKYSLYVVSVFTMFFFSCSNVQKKESSNKKPNVLLLYMDDLRPELNCYGASHISSPNIDKLAQNGVLFQEAYSNVSVCGASRASLLTGIRPSKNHFLNYNTFVEKEKPTAVTIPKLFRNNGYTTISNGKIFHHLDDNENDWDEVYRPYAFDKNDKNLSPTDYWQSLWKDYQNPENTEIYAATDLGPAFEKAAVHDSIYIDGIMTEKVIRDLKKLKKSNKPFFLTAGFISPHLPFNAPENYWNTYPENSIKQPYNNYVATNAPKISISNWGEMRSYTNIPKQGQVSDAIAKKLIHGYYATVSYTDVLIGKILNTLNELDLTKNTVVILVSDHGYNLQEHTQWAKFTSHKISYQVPLIISSPKINAGTKTKALVELVDIYPTLAELCNLKSPKNQLEGESLVPILKNPNQKGKEHIFLKSGTGYTVKTSNFAYTEFINPETNEAFAKMLYDHKKDPDENMNVVNELEYKETAVKLSKILHSTYQKNVTGN